MSEFVATTATGAVANTKSPYSPELRQLAYELWATKCSRDCRAVSRILATDDYDNQDVPDRTIRQWAKAEDWSGRVSADIQATFPMLRHFALSELVAASPEAAVYLRNVIRGEVVPDKNRIGACAIVLDRAGFSHIGRNDPSRSASSVDVVDDIPDLEDLDADQLMALEAEFRVTKKRDKALLFTKR